MAVLSSCPTLYCHFIYWLSLLSLSVTVHRSVIICVSRRQVPMAGLYRCCPCCCLCHFGPSLWLRCVPTGPTTPYCVLFTAGHALHSIKLGCGETAKDILSSAWNSVGLKEGVKEVMLRVIYCIIYFIRSPMLCVKLKLKLICPKQFTNHVKRL